MHDFTVKWGHTRTRMLHVELEPGEHLTDDEALRTLETIRGAVHEYRRTNPKWVEFAPTEGPPAPGCADDKTFEAVIRSAIRLEIGAVDIDIQHVSEKEIERILLAKRRSA